MIVGSRNNLSHISYIPEIKILGHNTERVHQIDQLGFVIDDQLKWDKHVDKLHNKLSSTLFSIKSSQISPQIFMSCLL